VTVTAHIKRTLTGTKPLYAVAGVSELAAEKLRYGWVVLHSNRGDAPKATRARARTSRPDVGVLTRKTEEFARDQINRAVQAYDDLAVRGETLVGRIRRQQTPEELVEQAQATIRRARAARNAVRYASYRDAERANGAGKAIVT